MPTTIVQPQPAVDVWPQEIVEPFPMSPVDDVARVVTPGDTGSTMPAAGSAVSVWEELEAMICLPLQTSVIRGGPKLRRSRMPVSIHTLRRSGRIAARPRAANSTRQAQIVLMRKLGLDVDTTTVDSEIERKFKAAFQGPMSANKQQALQILFSAEFDPVAMDLDMAELDTVEA
jgi:hypothetical protein